MAGRAATAKTITQVAALLAVLGVLGGMFYFARLHGEQGRAKEKAARAVSVLPAGVEEAWIGYVGRELSRKITRDGDVIRLAPDDTTDQTTFVSPSTPYQVECYPDFVMGAWINFGQGEDAKMIPFFGAVDFKIGGEEPPELGVDKNSVAAARLATRLCRQIVDYVQGVMGGSAATLPDGVPAGAGD